MPTSGSAKVIKGIRLKKSKMAEKNEAAVFAILQTGAAYAATLTPVDIGYLLQSQTAPKITASPTGVSGNVGYTAKYAAAVHEMSGKLKGQPRAHFGQTAKGAQFGGGSLTGTYWANGAEPKFLEKGFEMAKSSIAAILKGVYGDI